MDGNEGRRGNPRETTQTNDGGGIHEIEIERRMGAVWGIFYEAFSRRSEWPYGGNGLSHETVIQYGTCLRSMYTNV